jgi:sortase (surface protein transpeptidase)
MTKPRCALALLTVVLAAVSLAPLAGARSQHANGHYSPLIVIPRLGIRQEAQASLETGPIVYYYDEDTIGIAGHNVTPVPGYNGHGPFHYLKTMQVGDDVYVNHWHYVVVKKETVRPWDTSILDFKGVVLSACYPDHSANYRTAVFAKSVGPA